MGESQTHISLVEALVRHVSMVLPDRDMGYLYADLPNQSSLHLPDIINNFRPDLYFEEGARVIVGEAKTRFDIEKKHSIEQYRAFIRHCNGFEDATFVMAVPWDMTRLARNLLKKLLIDHEAQSVKLKVLDMLPG